MQAWKVWSITGAVMAVGALSALTAAVWSNVSSEWVVEKNAAQFALNHSPINHITSHSVFTASQSQEVFLGTDSFHRQWYAFVFGSPFSVQSVQVTGMVPKAEIIKQMLKQKIKPMSISIGYLNADAQIACQTTSSFVWEVIGQNSSQRQVYLFLDAYTGKQVWMYPKTTG